MPWSATHSPISINRSWWAWARTHGSGTIARRMGLGNLTPDVHGAVGKVDLHDVAGIPLEGRIVRSLLFLARVVDVPPTEIEILRREGVAPRLLALQLLVPWPDGFEQADRVGLVDELLGREIHQPMEVPPHRLVLAPMPAEQLRQQPLGVLLR